MSLELSNIDPNLRVELERTHPGAVPEEVDELHAQALARELRMPVATDLVARARRKAQIPGGAPPTARAVHALVVELIRPAADNDFGDGTCDHEVLRYCEGLGRGELEG